MPLNIDWQQILLHLFNFVILFVGLYFLLYKPVAKYIRKRQDYYKNMDDEANAKVVSATELESNCKKRLDELDDEINAKRRDAEAELVRQAETKMFESKKNADKIVIEAKTAAERERAQILSETKQEIAVLAVNATKKLLEQSANEALEQFLTAEERRTSNDRKRN